MNDECYSGCSLRTFGSVRADILLLYVDAHLEFDVDVATTAPRRTSTRASALLRRTQL